MIHRELYFATPIYIKDIGTPEYNKLLLGLKIIQVLKKQI